MTVSFPALVVMGPPHSGKSVLAYHLTRALRARQVAHFLLRTAPDGEGNWFFEGAASTTRLLRMAAKGRYSRTLVRQMLTIIRQRHLPLLVDIGGKPQGEQWDVMEVCTHGVLLYRQPADLDFWLPRLRRTRLTLLAVLQSRPREQDSLLRLHPYLQGVIGGLTRQAPRLGPTFQALVQRIQEHFVFSEQEVAAVHRALAPYPMLTERALAERIGKVGSPIWWEPEDLPRLRAHLPHSALALYGPGPIWLAAAIAALHAAWPLALFDTHFGWLALPSVRDDAPPTLTWDMLPLDRHWYLAIARLQVPFLEYGPLRPPPLPSEARGVLLFGKLPRWVYAGLTRFFARQGVAVALWEPRLGQAVGVTEGILGERLPLRLA